METREEYGHWEADTAHVGSERILTLIERKTRYSLCRKVGPDAQGVVDTIAELIANEQVPFKHSPRPMKFRTITFDNGSEFAYAPQLEKVFSELKIYFEDPGSPHQRGSNENFNGLLRWFFPKHGRPPPFKGTVEEAQHDLNHKRRALFNVGTSPRHAPSQRLTL